MAIVRTVLSPSGLIQPQHGGTGYEADMDQNVSILNALFRLVGEFALDVGLNGVYSGLALATSGSLTPVLSAGLLYAQGNRIVLDSPVNAGPAPASATNYLFYNSSLGFFYQASPVGTPGDALIGKVTTSGSAVTAVVTATKIFGLVDFTTGDDGNFTLQHYLGRAPVGVNLILTADGPVWFQSTRWDDTNLFLRAATAGLTGKAQVW